MKCVRTDAVAVLLVAAAAACGNDGPTQPSWEVVHPPELPLISEQSWDHVSDHAWSYLVRESTLDSDVASDGSAPMSPPSILRIAFTPDMPRDTEPAVLWTLLPQVREVYAEWWMKLSDNWTTSPSGAGKLTFLWAAEGQGQVYTHLAGPSGAHRVQVNTEWEPYGQRFWDTNRHMTPIRYGQWHHVGWYARWNSSEGAADGILQWWVDGVLNADYRDVVFPRCCFEQFEFAPTRQMPPKSVEYMFIDHTRVTAR